MRLVISLATRGRPQQLLDTLKRNVQCLAESNTLLMVQVDEDDQPTIKALSGADLDPRVVVNIKPREDTVAAKWNRALTEPAYVYSILGDDDPYVTPATDSKILHAASLFPDGIGMVYGHLANASFSSVICFTAKMTELLGYIQPEHFPYWFCDHWTDDVGRIVGRIAFADVRTDQRGAGKTQELREPAWWATWFDAAYLMRRKVAQGVIDALDEPDWRKEILHNHHPLIEYRSRWINDNVRAQARQLEGWSGLSNNDARYQRVRDAAVAMLPHLLDDYGMDPNSAKAYRDMLTPPSNVVGLKRAFS